MEISNRLICVHPPVGEGVRDIIMEGEPRPPTIKTAGAADLQSVAAIHVASFQDAYRGVLSDGFLDGLDAETSRQMWANTRSKFPENMTVAEAADGAVMGFCCAGPVVDGERNEGFDFEIYSLHVRPNLRRHGVGAALLRAAFERAQYDCLLNSAIVWTLVDLPLSCRFYEREGGTAVKTDHWQLGSERIPEIAYGWNDLARL